VSQKLISGQEDMKIKKTTFSTFVLQFFLPIQIQLLDIENKKIKTNSLPYSEALFLSPFSSHCCNQNV
jgi:hypothetical protein